MKRIIICLMLGTCLAISPEALALDSDQSSLVIDSGRFEQEKQKEDLGSQSSMIQSLFSSEAQEKLAEQSKQKEAEFQSNRAQLFENGQINATNIETVALFSKESSLVNTRVESVYGDWVESGWLEQVSYLGFGLVLVLGASYLSYRIYASED